MELKGKRITVMGLGINQGGVGVARFLARAGAQVLVTDLKTEVELKDSLLQLKGLPITYVLGKHQEQDFTDTDLIIRNPAVPDNSPFLKIALDHGVPIDTDMGLFFQLCPSKNIIGVTGTKGKSTTAALIYHILKMAEKDAKPRTALQSKAGAGVVLAGNMGISALDALEKIKPTTFVVLELSSFCLEGLDKHHVSPHTAVITNIMPDHLNRYKDFAAYAAAKALILKYQQEGDIAVLNKDDKECVKLHPNGKVLWYSTNSPHPALSRKGRGKIEEKNSPLLASPLRGEAPDPGRGVRVKTVSLRGAHNLSNIMAASTTAHVHGIDNETILNAIKTFQGLPHRMEVVARHEGVTFINDSAATNPSATIAAIKSCTEPLFLIVGGQDKNLPMEELARTIATSPHIQKIFLLTHPAYTASEKLMVELEKLGKGSMVVRVGSMDEGVQAACSLSFTRRGQGEVPRATILMSPAAASFGMFINEFDRGNTFKNEVQKIIG